MRSVWVRLHRWFGLATAVFLFIAGLTGALISWDHELDAWLNPSLYQSGSTGVPQHSLALAAQVERADPRVQVTFLPLHAESGHTLQMSVAPRLDPMTGKVYGVDYNQVALDPVTGIEQGRRYWGAVSLSRENLLPFLYKLHYSMHIPDVSGVELGIWFMGVIGIVWVLDSFIALYLSFPTLTSWRKSLAFRFKQGGYKLNFDLHRSGGVWVWLLLLTLAITSVSMNLGREVTRPVVSWFSSLSASPFDTRTPTLPEDAPAPMVSRAAVIALATQEARQRGWTDPPGGLFFSPEFGVYGVGFFAVGADHGDGALTQPRLGNPWLYFDAQSGGSLGALVPGSGSAGDLFLQAQFPLHSGRVIGMTGRVLVSLSGLLVSTLCVTGIVVWVRKRRARVVGRVVAPLGASTPALG